MFVRRSPPERTRAAYRPIWSKSDFALVYRKGTAPEWATTVNSNSERDTAQGTTIPVGPVQGSNPSVRAKAAAAQDSSPRLQKAASPSYLDRDDPLIAVLLKGLTLKEPTGAKVPDYLANRIGEHREVGIGNHHSALPRKSGTDARCPQLDSDGARTIAEYDEILQGARQPSIPLLRDNPVQNRLGIPLSNLHYRRATHGVVPNHIARVDVTTGGVQV
eukprot:scaffold529_cov308-Pinguiococcus_pyrenoidosus.AAC.40